MNRRFLFKEEDWSDVGKKILTFFIGAITGIVGFLGIRAIYGKIKKQQ